jgi:hypothetical protein
MATDQLDAFVAFNDKEDVVEQIVHELDFHGVTTFFWRRDMPLGADWKHLEKQKLAESKDVLVFLGEEGWGKNHLSVTENALALGKHVVPVLVGDPPNEAFSMANSLFRDRRYLDLRDL